ncbi:MAG: VWA domain-containing protein [Acidobacteriota bacterium]|nr:VWA domain-containing protein [Acidobacteriota bacterium]
MLHRIPSLASVLLLVGAASLAGQADPALEADDELFFATVDVNVVNVDVFVTDKQGNPVTGLGADDFELFEDNRPVQISNFYAVEGGRTDAVPMSSESAGSEPRPKPTEPQALPQDQRLFLIVYVDNYNIRPFNRNRVFRRLREFLHDRLGAADQVMLVSYDRSLNVRHPFTSRPEVIGRALYDLEKMTGHAMTQDSARREILQAIDEADDPSRVEWKVRQFAEEIYNDLSFTIDALRDFVGSVAGLEGRKAILYVSDGLAMTAAEELFQAVMQKFVSSSVMTRMHDYNAVRQFRELTALASSNRVSFYTIDAAGLRTSDITSAQSRGMETPGLMTLLDSTYRHNLQAPLRMMADETGGLAIVNTNDIGPGLEKMATDFETFYSLGYMPGRTGEGEYRRIRVELKNDKGLKVRHRAGYRSKSVFSHMADGTNSTLLYGFERNPLAVGLRVGSGSQHEDGLYLVPIAVDVPIGNLELVPQGDFHVGRIRIYFTAIDQEDRLADLQEVPLPIRIPNDEMVRAREQPYVYSAQLQMRAGSQRMAIGVRDEIGAVESFIVKSVHIGS